MPKRKPEIKQRFSSGNRVEIFVTRKAENFYWADAEWESFPPSPTDRKQYAELVAPRVVRLAERLNVQIEAAHWN